jgi:hypothetical protein
MKTFFAGVVSAILFLSFAQMGFAQSSIPPIKGISIGMPINEAVDKMNEKVGPMLASLTGGEPAAPYKLMKVPAGEMDNLRRDLNSLMTLVTMQLHPVSGSKSEDLYLVVPQRTADNGSDLKAVGVGVLQSVFLTGFFAWSGEDGKVRMFLIGPTICGALFDAQGMETNAFVKKFSAAYKLGKFEEHSVSGKYAARFLTHKATDGTTVAISQDELNRRSVVVWSAANKNASKAQEGSFD